MSYPKKKKEQEDLTRKSTREDSRKPEKLKPPKAPEKEKPWSPGRQDGDNEKSK